MTFDPDETWSARPRSAPGPERRIAGAGPAGTGVLHRRFSAGHADTRAVLGDLCGQLAARGLNEDELATLELVLAEALNNITEHAYGNDGGAVEMTIELGPSHILCELHDSGRPMPLGQAPRAELPLVSPPDVMPEGGFGWHIIRCLVAELSYERRDGRNRLRLVLPLSGAA